MDDVDQVRAYIEKVKNDVRLDNAEASKSLADYEIANIKLLSGDLVNYVYRVSFQSPSHKVNVILKYFPPFLANNKSIPFSQERYTVEKSALELLSNSPWLALNKNSIARTPKLYYSDNDSFVLIMEDVGEQSKSLLDLLRVDSGLNKDLLKQLASEIKFFIEYLAEKIDVTPVTNPEFENKAVVDVLRVYLAQVWQDQATASGLEAELSEYLQQSEIKFKAPDLLNEKVVWTFGDLWPNSILIDVEAERVWFIDWEAARFQIDPLRDMEQLACNLWLMKQNESVYDVNKVEFLIQELQLVHFGDASRDWRSMGTDRKTKFVLWVLSLIKEEHWHIENKREVLLKALNEVKEF